MEIKKETQTVIDPEIAKFTPDLQAVYTNEFVKAALVRYPIK